MDYRRLNITQLAVETKTTKPVLYDWIKKGFLKPTQISGGRRKYSINAFLEAEALALKESQTLSINEFLQQSATATASPVFVKSKNKKVNHVPFRLPGLYEPITAEVWDNLDLLCRNM